MIENNTFTLSESEARRMRRGAFLPILLILPMALMFGLDSSKSQPMHLLMTLVVACTIGAVIVSVSWFGVNRRISEFSQTRLSVGDGNLVWTTGARRTELNLADVTGIDVLETRKAVRQIVLSRGDGNRTILEGYERMDELLEALSEQSDVEVKRSRQWLGI